MAAAILLLGCGGGGGSRSPTAVPPAASPASLPAPRLIAPPAGAVIPQDDPSTGCPSSPTHGHGFQIRFHWEDVWSPAGIHGYDLVLRHRGSAFPALDRFVPTSGHLEVACNTYVADRNRHDWFWRVRARDGQGRPGAWSEERGLEFGSCLGCTCEPGSGYGE